MKSLRESIIDFIYRSATAPEEVRRRLAPLGGAFFVSMVLLAILDASPEPLYGYQIAKRIAVLITTPNPNPMGPPPYPNPVPATATLVLVVLLAAAATAVAQRRGGFGGPPQVAPILPNTPYDGRFTFVRVRYGPRVSYASQRIPWSHDYPTGERNFMR